MSSQVLWVQTTRLLRAQTPWGCLCACQVAATKRLRELQAWLPCVCMRVHREWERQCVCPGVHRCWCVYVGMCRLCANV